MPLSLLNCLRNSPPCCHSKFKIFIDSDRKADEEHDLKIQTHPKLKDQLAQASGMFFIFLSGMEHVNQQRQLSGVDLKTQVL